MGIIGGLIRAQKHIRARISSKGQAFYDSRNGLNIGGKVGPCPGAGDSGWLGSVRAVSETVHAANTRRSRFHVMARPS